MCPSDDHWIDQCLDGRPDAFRQLVIRYERPLLAYLTRRLGDPEAAREVAQESFVRAYFRLNTLRNKEDAFFSWLLGISHLVILEVDRQHRRERRLSVEFAPVDPSTLATSEDNSRLTDAVADLPDIYREVIVLRYYGGLSCAEVSQRLGVPLGTVTKRLSRAYRLLQGALRPSDGLRSEVRR